MIELVIPPCLGYGEITNGPIPANSTMHFVIELEQIQQPSGDKPGD
jgi:FKBP-type peptidyl-prolyl cis-trans isomerase